MLPTPARVGEGERHWFVWFVVSVHQRQDYKLRMVRK